MDLINFIAIVNSNIVPRVRSRYKLHESNRERINFRVSDNLHGIFVGIHKMSLTSMSHGTPRDDDRFA